MKKTLYLLRHGGRLLFGMALALLLAVGCSYPSPDYSKWSMTPARRDSLRFFHTHHYTLGYNFRMACDTVRLYPDYLSTDSVRLSKGDELVVADIRVRPSDENGDSVWVKVARDQATMGWISERQLLSTALPIDPISGFIHLFSNVHVLAFLVILGLFVLYFLFLHVWRRHPAILLRRSVSGYAVALCMLVACSATLYASMQLFVPETWRHYYYNPTLNPFILPFVLACFITSVWAIVLVFLAVVDDWLHKTTFPVLCYRLLELGVICLFLYLFFTLATLYYVGYPCLLFYLYYAVRRMGRADDGYLCGRCGRTIKKKGTCPYCGALNQ